MIHILVHVSLDRDDVMYSSSSHPGLCHTIGHIAGVANSGPVALSFLIAVLVHGGVAPVGEHALHLLDRLHIASIRISSLFFRLILRELILFSQHDMSCHGM